VLDEALILNNCSNPMHNSVPIQSITARVEVQTGELGAEKMDFSSKLGLEKSFWQ
jgi:hypothetical protein